MKDRHIRIGDDLWEALEREAKKLGISISAYIRLILTSREKDKG